MKNMKKPSPLGMFECFTPEVQELYNISAIHPLFHCQYGKTGDACDKPNKVPVSRSFLQYTKILIIFFWFLLFS